MDQQHPITIYNTLSDLITTLTNSTSHIYVRPGHPHRAYIEAKYPAMHVAISMASDASAQIAKSKYNQRVAVEIGIPAIKHATAVLRDYHSLSVSLPTHTRECSGCPSKLYPPS